jgi:sigma-54-specific transcriptional regulator
MVEAELFGHENGAFTGAQQARAGWFEAANGGTLFLDEVGDLSMPIQVKLLRVLQEREVTRIGSRKPVQLDVRLVAATNVELGKAVQSGHFRLDLFYRLNIASVRLPPLRERRGDIMPLVDHFIELYRRKLGMDEISLTPEAERALLRYDWPGNIRELENVIHFALILCGTNTIGLSDLRLPGLAAQGHDALFGESAARSPLEKLEWALQQMLAEDTESIYEAVERLLITTAFNHCSGNQVQSAKRLGISRNVLRAQLKRFDLLGNGDRAFPEVHDELAIS